MAKTTDLSFDGGAIVAPGGETTSAQVHTVFLHEITITDAGQESHIYALFDKNRLTASAPFFEPVSSFNLAEWCIRGDAVQVDLSEVMDSGTDRYSGLLQDLTLSNDQASGMYVRECTLRTMVKQGTTGVRFAWFSLYLVMDQDTSITYLATPVYNNPATLDVPDHKVQVEQTDSPNYLAYKIMGDGSTVNVDIVRENSLGQPIDPFLRISARTNIIDLDFIEPIFFDQISRDKNVICYDARLDNVLYKLPAQYKKAVCVRNLQALGTDVINTGVTTDDGHDIEMIACIRVDRFVAYGRIIGNDYISDDDNYFAIACGAYEKQVNCFVNTNYTSILNMNYEDGSGLLLSQTGNDRIAKDVRYPFTSYLAPNTSRAQNLSSIKIFGIECKASIFYCRLKKSGIVVKDYIPCVRLSDNVPGFFEKVSQEFVTVQDPSKLEAII